MTDTSTTNAVLREALRRIAEPLDCGCQPCTEQCRSVEALLIELEERQEIASAALAAHAPQSQTPNGASHVRPARPLDGVFSGSGVGTTRPGVSTMSTDPADKDDYINARPTLREGLEAIADGEGDAQVIAQQTLDVNPVDTLDHRTLEAFDDLETHGSAWLNLLAASRDAATDQGDDASASYIEHERKALARTLDNLGTAPQHKPATGVDARIAGVARYMPSADWLRAKIAADPDDLSVEAGTSHLDAPASQGDAEPVAEYRAALSDLFDFIVQQEQADTEAWIEEPAPIKRARDLVVRDRIAAPPPTPTSDDARRLDAVRRRRAWQDNDWELVVTLAGQWAVNVKGGILCFGIGDTPAAAIDDAIARQAAGGAA